MAVSPSSHVLPALDTDTRPVQPVHLGSTAASLLHNHLYLDIQQPPGSREPLCKNSTSPCHRWVLKPAKRRLQQSASLATRAVNHARQPTSAESLSPQNTLFSLSVYTACLMTKRNCHSANSHGDNHCDMLLSDSEVKSRSQRSTQKPFLRVYIIPEPG